MLKSKCVKMKYFLNKIDGNYTLEHVVFGATTFLAPNYAFAAEQ